MMQLKTTPSETQSPKRRVFDYLFTAKIILSISFLFANGTFTKGQQAYWVSDSWLLNNVMQAAYVLNSDQSSPTC